jgi:tetratricopeptide (TPR) repeat protein
MKVLPHVLAAGHQLSLASTLRVVAVALVLSNGSHAFAAGETYNFDPTKSSDAPAREYGQFGPFDYYDLKNTPRNALPLVERGHFGPKTQNLARIGNWCFYWGDLDYTLRAFPNHPKALVAMADFLTTHETPCERPRKANPTAADLAEEIEKGTWRDRTPDYYFDTAIKYRAQYAETRILYGQYLQRAGKLDDAIKQFAGAEKAEPNSADAHYYLGLAYFKRGDKEKARTQAERAYGLGQGQVELKEKLIAAGLWTKK